MPTDPDNAAPFELYDPNRSDVDARARRILDKLSDRFGAVEIKDTGEEWCVRIIVGEGDDELPLAALGKTLGDAAERMQFVVASYEDEQ